MNMNVLKQLILVGCIFSACAKPPEHAKWAQDTAKAFTQLMEKSQGLHSLGSGGFYTNKKIDSLYLDFEIRKRVSHEEAKALLTTIVDTFIEYVNQNEGIRPFLQTYPITPNQVSASIAFVDDKKLPLAGFSQIHLYEGVIYYSIFQPEKKEYSSYQKELYPKRSVNLGLRKQNCYIQR